MAQGEVLTFGLVLEKRFDGRLGRAGIGSGFPWTRSEYLLGVFFGNRDAVIHLLCPGAIEGSRRTVKQRQQELGCSGVV